MLAARSVAALVALTTTAVAAAPVARAAPNATLDARCYIAGRAMTVSGSGFVPNAPLAILGGASPRATMTDGGGRLSPVRLTAPAVRTLSPRAITVRIRDVQDASVPAALPAWVVREPFDTNAPIAGLPSQATTWRFAGFVPGQPIYGHFRLRGRTLRNYGFGTARGACGTLVARARRIPVLRAPPGDWLLKLDQRPRYVPGTAGREIRFRIAR